MDSPLPPPVESALTCLPYAHASPPFISRALIFLQQELASHFPEPVLDWLTWAKALAQLRPDLWVAPGEIVTLDAQDVKRLAQYLTGSPELPTLEPPLYGPHAAYLAKRLVRYADEARAALVELEAYPKAYGPCVWNLVLTIALGNATADEVYHATWWDVKKGEEPAAAGPNVQARILALRRARGGFVFLKPDLENNRSASWQRVAPALDYGGVTPKAVVPGHGPSFLLSS
jgi:hypothetical protein